MNNANLKPQDQTTDSKSGPWYKEPMMWLVLGLPAVVVVAGFFTLYIASSRPETLVNAPHTKIGFTVEKVQPQEKPQQGPHTHQTGGQQRPAP